MATQVKILPRIPKSAAGPKVIAGLAVALLYAGVATAQNSVPGQRLPGLDDFDLPGTRPTPSASPTPEPTTNPKPIAVTITPPPAVPTVVPTVVPRPRVTARETPTLAPRPTATPTREPVPSVRATPSPEATAQPTAAAKTPEPVPSDTNTVAPAPTESAAAPLVASTPEGTSGWIWWVVGAVIAALAAVGIFIWSRKQSATAAEARDRSDETILLDAGAPLTAASPGPASVTRPVGVADRTIVPAAIPTPAAPPPTAGPTLEVELQLKRAGTNLLSAAVEYAIVVRNMGTLPVDAVQISIRLLSAGPDQDAMLAAVFGGPAGQPAVAPFQIAPGESVALDGMAMRPRDALHVIAAGDKAFFVPLLTIDVRYAWQRSGESPHGQSVFAWVVGRDRGAERKLAPFPANAGARMYADIAARLVHSATA